jgi:hypothetical protein
VIFRGRKSPLRADPMTEPTADELVVSKVKDALSDMQGMVSEAGFASCVRDLQEFVPRLLALVAAQAGQLAELRAGEADADPEEDIIPTPAQWLRKYNRAVPERRLSVAAKAIEDADIAARCRQDGHEQTIAVWRDRAERAEATP